MQPGCELPHGSSPVDPSLVASSPSLSALSCGLQVYCAPTSGGKSLVAEVLMVRRLLLSLQHIPQPRRSKPVSGLPCLWGGCQCMWGAKQISTTSSHVAEMLQKYGRALVVLPYASIVSEKTEHLAAVLKPMHATVKGRRSALA